MGARAYRMGLWGVRKKLSLFWGWRQNRGEHEDKQARASALIHPEGQSSSLSVKGHFPTTAAETVTTSKRSLVSGTTILVVEPQPKRQLCKSHEFVLFTFLFSPKTTPGIAGTQYLLNE